MFTHQLGQNLILALDLLLQVCDAFLFGGLGATGTWAWDGSRWEELVTTDEPPPRVRAAMAGYLLRRWNVDCTEDHGLKGTEYHLWLRNRQALYGVTNLVLAPGYGDSAARE